MQDSVHKGHRARMRRKLLEFSHRVFDTYELLEMLLYYTNSVRDTNPVAKELLSKFGGLDGVLSKDADALASVSGVGTQSAKLIRAQDTATKFFRKLTATVTDTDRGAIIAEIVHHLSEYEIATTVLVSLDNAGRIIAKDKLFSLDFSSGGIKPASFVSTALDRRCASCIIAHSHPFGPAFPSESDMATQKLVTDALSTFGIGVNACLVTCGMHYYDSVSRTSGTVAEDASGMAKPYESEAALVLSDLFSSAFSDGEKRLAALYGKAPSAGALLTSHASLGQSTPEQERVLLSLVCALASRRISDKYIQKKKYSDANIEECLVGHFLGASHEQVLMLSLDEGGALISVDFICEGTVSGGEILPRMLLDTVARRCAHSVILAHNHPYGRALPSEEDISATKRLYEMLAIAGVHLDCHYVVAEGKAVRINF